MDLPKGKLELTTVSYGVERLQLELANNANPAGYYRQIGATQ